MERDRKISTRIILATSLFLTTCLPKNQTNKTYAPLTSPTPEHQILPTPTIMPATPTATPHPTATPPAEVRNGMTGAIYHFTNNPEGKSGRCVRLGEYSSTNKQDVFGAATALGPNPNTYNDYPSFKVYMPDFKTIGSFTTDEIPMHETFGVVPPGTIICEN